MTIRDKIVVFGAQNALSNATKNELALVLREAEKYDPKVVKIAKEQMIKRMQEAQNNRQTPCPYCKENIHPEAVKCPFCQSNIPRQAPPNTAGVKKNETDDAGPRSLNKAGWIIFCIVLLIMVYQHIGPVIDEFMSFFKGIFIYENVNAPVAIKKFTVLCDSDYGATVYFSLIDNEGNETAANGTAEITFIDRDSFNVGTIKKRVMLEHFKTHNIGLGMFQHKEYICPLGMIPFSEILDRPPKRRFDAMLQFTTSSGQTFVKKYDGVIL